MSYLPRLALVFAVAFIFGGCSSENLSSKGQMIECTSTANGPTDCHPTDSSTPSQAGACVDVDEDGDGDDHDSDGSETEDHDEMDDDSDGTADDADSDDDNDGIADTDDCDETTGGDDHDD